MQHNKPRRLILELNGQRGPDKSICPTEVARAAFRDKWRTRMPEARRVADEPASEGRVVFQQRGREVDVISAHGPIRPRILAS